MTFRYQFLVRRSQWSRGLRRRSTAARLLRLWIRIPPGAWMFVCGECCVLSGRGLCVGLLTRPEESYWADHSSREVLLTVVRRCEWPRNLVNEEALAYWGLLRQKQTNFCFKSYITLLMMFFRCDYLLHLFYYFRLMFCYSLTFFWSRSVSVIGLMASATAH
jgi:hypothetical protein